MGFEVRIVKKFVLASKYEPSTRKYFGSNIQGDGHFADNPESYFSDRIQFLRNVGESALKLGETT